jgi:glycosyltransferase involved in cell wall biosynthesis
MRLAYFSPLPPTQSGIADYSNELLPHLAKRADISLFTDSPDSIDAALLDRFVTYPLGDFPRLRREYDLALYHMGNNVHHETIYEFAIRYPGVVVLHDLFLHHFIGSITFVKGDYASYVRELGYALDSDGLHLFMDIRLGKRRFPVFDVPLCDRIIDRSLALLVHSVSAASAVQNMRPDRPVRVIPALIAEHQGKSLRGSLDVRDETVIFASLGFVNATKQIEMALRQFARLRETRPDIHYVIVGGVQGNFDLKGLITRLGHGLD